MGQKIGRFPIYGGGLTGMQLHWSGLKSFNHFLLLSNIFDLRQYSILSMPIKC